jgi:UBA/TS-N domain
VPDSRAGVVWQRGFCTWCFGWTIERAGFKWTAVIRCHSITIHSSQSRSIVRDSGQLYDSIRECYAGLHANSGVEEQKVKDIVEMGFTAEQARAALDACGMDKQAAIDFILSQV